MTAFVNHPEGDMGIRGRDEDAGVFIPVVYEINPGSDTDITIVTVPRAMRVRALIGRPDVLNGAALTATIRKVPSGTAVASGTALHGGSFDLNAGLNTNQVLAVSSTEGVANLVAGDSIAVDLSTVNTAAVGTISVWMNPR